MVQHCLVEQHGIGAVCAPASSFYRIIQAATSWARISSSIFGAMPLMTVLGVVLGLEQGRDEVKLWRSGDGKAITMVILGSPVAQGSSYAPAIFGLVGH